VSYFDAKSTFVHRSGISSVTTACNYGVPQGSSLRPLCFNLYIAPLSSVIGSFGVRHHQYADDTQMYIAAQRTTSRWTLTNSKSVPSLQDSDTVIQPSATIKSLGITLDRHLTFDQHVANVCKACYFHIRALRHVLQSLSDMLQELSPAALSAQGSTIATHCLSAWLTATLRNCSMYRIH